jgi:urease accessory protein
MPTYPAVVLSSTNDHASDGNIELTAEERLKTIVSWQNNEGEVIYLRFSRGNRLRAGDFIQIPDLSIVLQVIARAELVLTITAMDHRSLIRAAYHLGNRHVPLEIGASWLRLHPDPVIEQMLLDMDLTIIRETVPFFPETGAYHHH